MARVTAFSALYPFIQRHCPGAEIGDMLSALYTVGRDFCERTEAWKETLDPQLATEYKEDYHITLPTAYTAQIHRLVSVKLNQVCLRSCQYDLFEEDILRLNRNAIYQDLDDMLLVCGAAGSAVYTGWTGITAGSVTFSIGGETYGVTGINLSTATSMDDVASIIQTALRTEMENQEAYVRWANTNTRFIVWTDSGEVSYLTAGTAGTDISGALWMNGLTGATACSVGPMLQLELVLRPDISTDTAPDWFMDRWGDAFVAGCVSLLCSMPNTTWTNAQKAAEQKSEYNGWVTRALAERSRESKDVYTTLGF